MIVYLAAWSTACVVALVVASMRWRSFAIARRTYVIGMTRPWKLVTFALAFAGIVLVAPRSGDPTWDHADAAFMAVLVYTTAPWTLGVLYRARTRSRAEVYVAACVWLFSASFSYDLYIFLRDGHYPRTWWSNLIVSSGLYGLGGAMWSLRGQSGARHGGAAAATGRPTFAFLRDDWPASLADGSTRPLLPYIAIFMIAIVGILSPFLIEAIR
ncbi:MAG TPA: hypothetical protein VH054_08210 [Polyangiaceae bacterium]|nr:hypothetical protein [Polyangiaceae bacterium]